MEPIFFTLLNSMTWKDTRAAASSAKVLSKLVTVLSKDGRFHAFFGGAVIDTAIHVRSRSRILNVY